MTVGLVIVSHSSKIAEGVVDLAAQMAEGVRIVAAGGTDDDGIGTSFDKVSAAVVDADDGAGVVVLCDLGSAILTAETALDFVDDDVRERIRIADAPLVEGSIAAAVAAQIGGTLDEVVTAAQSANVTLQADADAAAASSISASEKAEEPGNAGDSITGATELVNASGLHARPAAEFVRLASTFDAQITINGVDAKSLLRIMSLGLGRGKSVGLAATGPDARAAIDALTALIDSGFGE
jgi:PTS hybrid protein